MKTVAAARLQKYGGPEAVRVEDTALPEPKAGELRIRVHAAGINPIDWKIRAGYLQQAMPLQFPATSGGDFSGVVEIAGPERVDFKAGDEVFGQASLFNGGSGSFAQYCIASAASTAAKPRTLSHAEASGLPLAGVSALQALIEHLLLRAGQKVLIHGGAGGIGSIGIQIAKHVGARVATTVSAGETDYVKGLGADTVIDYKTQDFEDAVSDFDAVFDTVGGDTYVRSFKVLKRGGQVVSMLERPRQDLMEEFGVRAIAQFSRVTSDRLTKLAELVDAGIVKVRLDKIFPLEQAAAALQHLEKDSPRGKVVLKLA